MFVKQINLPFLTQCRVSWTIYCNLIPFFIQGNLTFHSFFFFFFYLNMCHVSVLVEQERKEKSCLDSKLSMRVFCKLSLDHLAEHILAVCQVWWLRKNRDRSPLGLPNLCPCWRDTRAGAARTETLMRHIGLCPLTLMWGPRGGLCHTQEIVYTRQTP